MFTDGQLQYYIYQLCLRVKQIRLLCHSGRVCHELSSMAQKKLVQFLEIGLPCVVTLYGKIDMKYGVLSFNENSSNSRVTSIPNFVEFFPPGRWK
jgi:hypothetical protein